MSRTIKHVRTAQETSTVETAHQMHRETRFLKSKEAAKRSLRRSDFQFLTASMGQDTLH